MINKNIETLKKLYFEAKEVITVGKKTQETLLVEVYQYFVARYDVFTKADAKEVMLCLSNNNSSNTHSSNNHSSSNNINSKCNSS